MMTSFARFHNLPLNLYDLIGDVTDQLKKSEINIFLETIVSKVTKILHPKHHTSNIMQKIRQEIQISARHALQNAVAMATPGTIIKILQHRQIAR